MPKIPTYTARGRITAEAPGVRTNIQVSPFQTTAGELSKVAKVAEDYYIKQRDNNEKLEARKTFYEMKSESDKIIKKYENEPDDFKSVNGYNEEFGVYRNQKLSTIKNKRVKKRLEDLLVADQAETVYKIKKNSFKAFEVIENQSYNNGQNILANEYALATNKKEKEKILNKQIELAKEHGNMHLKGEAWLKKETLKLKSNSILFDVNQAIGLKDYNGAKTLLIKNKNNIDSDEFEKKLLEINTQYVNVLSDQNIDNIILNEQGPAVVGANIKNIDGKEITEKDLEKGANRFALEKNPDGKLKYSTAQVIEKTVKNNIKVPFYLSALDAGGNITDTSNPEATRAGLELYRTFKNQNALQSLTSIYQLDKDDLATYQRLDFSMNVMKQTFDQAYKNELMFKNNPDKYKLLKADGKSVTDEVNKLDFPGVTPFEFGLEFENNAYANQIIKNVANNAMIATGSEKGALEFARKYVEQNYRVDDFKQLVPINNAYPEYHDAAIKLYIKNLYESGRINKEQHKEEDIIPVYFTVGSLTSNQGFVLRDKTTGVPITIDVVTPQGDFDEGNYDDARFTYKEIVEKIYPLMKDKRYNDFVNNYNRIQLEKQTFDLISTETP
tara:strand:+ start:445 stop:2283 length:1839 start_codon:yes stop_codon:yes gene_type:complete